MHPAEKKMIKNKRTSFICLLISLLIIIGSLPTFAESGASARDRARSISESIIEYNLDATGSKDVQEWIDGSLSENAGMSSEWYILSLCQSTDADFSKYETSLLSYLDTHRISAASTQQKYALCLAGVGSTNGYISAVMDTSVGKQGIMSYIYGLHLLNNGYNGSHTSDQVIDAILSSTNPDGGWSVSTDVSDVDVSAMAIQALAPHYSNEQVKTCIDNALDLLSQRQLDDGDFKSYGVANPESGAQVVVALSALGIDCETDMRFIKNGKTLFDGISKYALDDGSFAHKADGGTSAAATAQVLYATVAYLRMSEGASALYILDKCDPENVLPAPEASAQTNDTSDQNTEPNAKDTAPDKTLTLPEKHSYKLYVSIAIACVGMIVCIVLIAAKKRSLKNLLAVAVVCAICITAVCLTDIKSVDDYYGSATEKENAIGTVTLTIRCDAVAGSDKNEYIPADGVILDVTELAFADGDTVYTVLTDAARQFGIHVENNGNETLAYVSGINYLYEFDFGDLSGWTYLVNGERVSVGCGEYKLSDGDHIEWHYTLELGNDLK